MIIQIYNPTESHEVQNVVREAFWNVYAPGCDEHYLAHKLVTDSAYVPQLNYVAKIDGKIVGVIFYCWGKLVDAEGNATPILNLGPVAVLPEFQRQGIASQLIRHTLQLAKDLGYNGVVLCGDTKFYHRFGFDTATKCGIFYDDMDQNDPAEFFMLCKLDKNFSLKGIYHEADCYLNVDKNAVDEFDKQFEPKQKLKLDSQIFG